MLDNTADWKLGCLAPKPRKTHKNTTTTQEHHTYSQGSSGGASVHSTKHGICAAERMSTVRAGL